MNIFTVLLFIVILFAAFIGAILLMPRFIQVITESEIKGTKSHRFEKESGFRGHNILSGMGIFLGIFIIFAAPDSEGTVMVLLFFLGYFGYLHYKVLSDIKVMDAKFYKLLYALASLSLYFNIAQLANWANVFMSLIVSLICGLIWGIYTVYLKTMAKHNKL